MEYFNNYRANNFGNQSAFTSGSGLSQSRGLCKSLGLTPAAPRKKRGAGPAEKEILGCRHPKPHSVKLLVKAVTSGWEAEKRGWRRIFC
jgi:hypothetical protein